MKTTDIQTTKELQIDTKLLKNILNIVSGASTVGEVDFSNLSTSVSLHGSYEKLVVSVTGPRMTAYASVENVEIRDDFSIAVSFSRLKDFLSKTLTSRIRFVVGENSLTVYDGNDQLVLASLPQPVFMSVPKCDSVWGELDLKSFKDYLARPMKPTGNDQFSGIMSLGVMIYGDKAIGTTKEYMVYTTLPYDKIDTPLFVPRDFVRELTKITGTDKIIVSSSEAHVKIQFTKKVDDGLYADCLFFAQQLDKSSFPSVIKILEQPFGFVGTVNVDLLKNKVDKLRVLSRSANNTLVVKVEDGLLMLSLLDQISGSEVSTEIEFVEQDPELELPLTFGLSLTHFTDVISTLSPSADVAISINDSKAITMFQQDEHKQFLVVRRLGF